MDATLIICRLLQYVALMLVFGASSFSWLLAPAAVRAHLDRSLRWPLPILGVAVAVTAALWLGLETGEIGNGWSDVVNPAMIGTVLTGTLFGQVWLGRLGLALLLVIATILRMHRPGWVVPILSAMLLGSLGLVGHAAMHEGTLGWIQRLNEIVHLLSAGFWLGCLPVVLLCLPLFRRHATREDAAGALHRFSGFGHVAVALVLATGVVNTLLIVGGLPVDFSSPYQALLDIKIALVAAMVTIAICNRYVLMPRFATTPERARHWLMVGTVGELAIGAVVLALVSAFGTFDPMSGHM